MDVNRLSRLIAAIPAEAETWDEALNALMIDDDEYVATLADELGALYRATDEDGLVNCADVAAAGLTWRDLESLYMGGVLNALDELPDSGCCLARFAPLDAVRGVL